jgi:hypothetical protein
VGRLGLYLLRGLVLLALLLAFLDPRLPLPGPVVYLLDFSPSARESVFALAERLPREAVYVAFAERAALLPSPTARRLDLGEGTDLRAAFAEALRLRPSRVVLVSDGLFSPVPPPFPLDALYVPPKAHVDLRLVPPLYPLQGETVGVGVVLEAPRPTEALMRVEGPAGPLERRLRVEGRRVLTYPFPLTEEAEVRAVAEGPWGRSEAKARLLPADRVRALVLGDPALARYLEAQGFLVEEAFRLPLEADLVAVGLGVLDLPPGAPEALKDYLRRGGGLLFTATPKGLFFGGWDRALPEDLPLKPLGRKGAALVLVLDVSGSMEGEKLAMAVAGALELVRSAAPEDYLGVVLFSSGPRVLFPPRPMTEQGKKEAESLLLSLRAGGGTVLGGAFREALRLLEGVPVERKAILVLYGRPHLRPQGAPAGPGGHLRGGGERPGPGAGRRRRLPGSPGPKGRGAVLPGGHGPGASPPLPEGGAGGLPRENGWKGGFPWRPCSHPLTQGFAFPPLAVLLPARAEPWAEVLLKSGERVVLALGERGEGRVAALATDLSRSWKGWEEAAPFLGGLARYLAGGQRGLALYAYPEGEGVRAVVLGRLEAPQVLVGGKEVPLVPTGPLRYEAVLREEGVLLSGKLRLPLALPLPGEWTPRDGEGNLKALAEGSGGRLLTLEELPRRATTSLPLRPYLLALALVLFLLERVWEGRVGRVTFWEASQA